jgi:hypothetical protein
MQINSAAGVLPLLTVTSNSRPSIFHQEYTVLCNQRRLASNLVWKENEEVPFGLVGGPVPLRKLVDHMNQRRIQGGEMAAATHH